MNRQNIKKTYQLKIKGSPTKDLEIADIPDHVGISPAQIPFIKPKLLVKEGDEVKTGSPLFFDKRNPEIKYLSPGGGIIEEIEFGPRRIINEIKIKLDADEKYEEFETISVSDLDTLSRDELIQKLMNSGLWQFIRELPFRDYADTINEPRVIFVNINSKEPFKPNPEIYLKGQKDLFEFGIKILEKLTNYSVYIYTAPEFSDIIKNYKSIITHALYGAYPADDPGVLLYYLKKSQNWNRSWFINGQDLLSIAKLFSTGKYPTGKIVSLGGTSAKVQKHFKLRSGSPLSLIAGTKEENPGARFIVGGVFRGYTSSPEKTFGFYDDSLTIIPEGDKPEAFGFLRPGYNKPGFSRAFLSYFNKGDYLMDTALHGEDRSCINCGTCVKVCPVDILPQFTYKSVYAEEFEEAIEHGLLDCVECGLCSYVCPSKIPICVTLKNAKHTYYSEK